MKTTLTGFLRALTLQAQQLSPSAAEQAAALAAVKDYTLNYTFADKRENNYKVINWRCSARGAGRAFHRNLLTR